MRRQVEDIDFSVQEDAKRECYACILLILIFMPMETSAHTAVEIVTATSVQPRANPFLVVPSSVCIPNAAWIVSWTWGLTVLTVQLSGFPFFLFPDT
ncbi:hypothetical protein AVEN_196131-1 [Araneus ventricosus]|uniref:Uncharacterized protein n=1 Tax=Araneus ventricosus TaxID=182803 RepID=A0A4Y2E0W0_ARAVE|nr:hypothetical protein AVEN_196131-1 [Araneus ventricosus]